MRALIIPLFLSAMISCNNKSNDKPTSDSLTTKSHGDSSVIVRADTLYGYIKSIEQFHDSIFVEFDPVEYFHGPGVVEEAKKRHRADTARDRSGKITDIFVPDDYFIVNDDSTVRRMNLVKGAAFDLLDEKGNSGNNEVNNFQYLQNHFLNNFFRILTGKNSDITKVDMIYLP